MKLRCLWAWLRGRPHGCGTHDDTKLVQAALNHKGSVYLKSGTYKISDTLACRDLKIVGSRKGTTTIEFS